MPKRNLTAQRLREVYAYDPATGVFTRVECQRGGGRSTSGEIGAVTYNGYRVLSIDSVHYLAHRLAWLYVSGEWPSRWLTHVNGNKLDNRIDNLRFRKSGQDNKETKLTQERLKEVFRYEEETGKFFWKIKSGRAMIGNEAGVNAGTGYRYMSVDGQRYLAHRLAWFYAGGVWPVGQIDHINGVRDDNRLTNLRDVNGSANCHNSKVRARNTTGYKGVSKRRNKFLARITVNYRIIDLGVFDTAELAYAARLEAEKTYLSTAPTDGEA